MVNLSNPIKEALKELGRNVILAVVPTGTVALQSVVDGSPVNWKVTGIVAAALAGLAILRSIDRWVHENASVGPKAVRESNGLVPF